MTKNKANDMKINNIWLHSAAAVAAAALVSACSNDSVVEVPGNNPGKTENVTLVANQPGSGTRMGFTKEADGTGKAYWQKNDAIGVWSNGESKFNSFGIASGAGGATATFSGTVTDGVGKYAVYPYNEKHGIKDNVLTYYLPEKYTYASVDQTFFPTENNGNSFNMPMLGTVSDGQNGKTVSFSHLAGVICLQIDKMPAKSGTVTVTAAGKQLCGAFTASLTDTNPEITTTASETDNAVTFEYSGSVVDNPGVFYLPAATGDYALTVVVSGDKKTSSTTHSVKMVREGLQVVKVTTEYFLGKIINGHKFIDLGLPSGLLWAETNIGAETAYDDGNYYAWGEVTAYNEKTDWGDENVKTNYSWNTYKYGTASSSLTKYNSKSGKTVLEPEDDAATANWGKGCRMPTKTEFEELNNSENCTWTKTSQTNSAGETISCYKVVSKNNGNIIYLPASGYRSGNGLDFRGSRGAYWSSTLGTDDVSYAYDLYFINDEAPNVYDNFYRNSGNSVRPVAKVAEE